ncbi:MAG: hypothetical protein AAFQ94_30955 [Bacteroidota bacterium]
MSDTTEIENCFSNEDLIEFSLERVFSEAGLQYTLCESCFKKYCGLSLSLEQARLADPTITDAQFKKKRLAEIAELEKIFGIHSKAVDLAIKGALSGSEAVEILKSLGFKEIHLDGG